VSDKLFMGRTEVDVPRTIGDIMGVLGRAPNVKRIAQHWEQGKPAGIEFGLELKPGFVKDYRLPVRTEAVWGRLQSLRSYKGAKNREHAERVAWRQVFRWLEAQLAMIETGNSSSQEIFLPFLLDGPGGKTLFEAWQDSQLLLEAPKS